MDQVSIYIKKLIALALSAFIMLFLNTYIPLFLSVSLSFLVLSFLHFNITGEKPAYLFGMAQSDRYLSEKGGFWLLFRWILMLFGFVYDIIVWTINGVYVLFLILIDILLLIKTILFWIIHAIIWFLSLFVPPLVFIYRMIIRYLIFWPWWIYKATFRNTGLSINANFYRVAYIGAAPGLFILLLFYGAAILTGAPVISVFGLVFAFLPVIWSFGEISSIRNQNRWNTSWDQVRSSFSSGFDAMRAVLFYLTIMLAGILIEIVMDLAGWINGAGFSLLGLSLNVNTLVSLVLLFVFVILLFASLMISPYVVRDPGHSNDFPGSVRFLGVIGSRFLRYLLSLFPATFFSVILALIPAIIVGLSVYITLNVKDFIIDSRIDYLSRSMITLQDTQKAEIRSNVERLKYYKDFPENVFTDFTNLKELKRQKNRLQQNSASGREELRRLEEMYRQDMDSLDQAMTKLNNPSDSLQTAALERMKATQTNKTDSFNRWRDQRSGELRSLDLKIRDLNSRIIQLPVAFLMVIIWVAVFGGIVLSVILSYLGNVFYSLYSLKEDGRPTYWFQVARAMKEKDHNQPLLGFTLLVIVVVIIVLFVTGVRLHGTGIFTWF